MTHDPNNDIDALWAKEAEERVDAYNRGEIIAVPAEEVFNAIFNQQTSGLP